MLYVTCIKHLELDVPVVVFVCTMCKLMLFVAVLYSMVIITISKQEKLNVKELNR